jgi:hypothetical protein
MSTTFSSQTIWYPQRPRNSFLSARSLVLETARSLLEEVRISRRMVHGRDAFPAKDCDILSEEYAGVLQL